MLYHSYESAEFELLLSHRAVNSASSAQKADAAQMQVNDVLCLSLGSHQSLTTYYKDLKNLKKLLVHKSKVFLHSKIVHCSDSKPLPWVFTFFTQ